jgi:hypothetical protein
MDQSNNAFILAAFSGDGQTTDALSDLSGFIAGLINEYLDGMDKKDRIVTGKPQKMLFHLANEKNEQ